MEKSYIYCIISALNVFILHAEAAFMIKSKYTYAFIVLLSIWRGHYRSSYNKRMYVRVLFFIYGKIRDCFLDTLMTIENVNVNSKCLAKLAAFFLYYFNRILIEIKFSANIYFYFQSKILTSKFRKPDFYSL